MSLALGKPIDDGLKEDWETEEREVKDFIWNQPVLTDDTRLAPYLAKKVVRHMAAHREMIYSMLKLGEDEYLYPLSHSDYSMYYGDGGLAYMNFHLFLKISRGTNYDLLNEAARLVEKPLRLVSMERITFLIGDSGIVALAAVVFHLVGRRAESQALLQKLLETSAEVCEDPTLGNELGTGRCGFLFSLLFVRRHIGVEHCGHIISDAVVRRVFFRIVKDGRDAAILGEKGKMLWFTRDFNETVLGAWQGMAGILHTLLQVDVPDARGFLLEYLPGTLEYLLPMKLPSGNRPMNNLKTVDLMTAWCQGSAGWVHMFVKAYELLLDKTLLDAAAEAEEVVWNQGYSFLLEDKHSLCHGMSGNAYCHLAMFRATKDEKYYRRACRIGLKCFRFNSERNIQRRPFCLMDGLAGTVCFLADLVEPTGATFPGYEV